MKQPDGSIVTKRQMADKPRQNDEVHSPANILLRFRVPETDMHTDLTVLLLLRLLLGLLLFPHITHLQEALEDAPTEEKDPGPRITAPGCVRRGLYGRDGFGNGLCVFGVLRLDCGDGVCGCADGFERHGGDVEGEDADGEVFDQLHFLV